MFLFNEKFCSLIQILLKFVSQGFIDISSSLVQAMFLSQTSGKQCIAWTNDDLGSTMP